ncbi:Rhodanese-like protein [Artomyces pyxidatus]|uniref:Rhodanese-like protein n=1 Tax=Artomyces pyxidatus TaxID=48021 RepID=A0ACB8TAB9_9AGAM|nr:Rhodanese-like protein [Artomyces pyxidatus]
MSLIGIAPSIRIHSPTTDMDMYSASTPNRSASSPTSFGVTPVDGVKRPPSFNDFHREEVSNSSITTPVFSAKSDKGNDTPSLRTLDDVRDQVAERLAVRAVRKLKLVDNTKIAVILTLVKKDDADFLRLVAQHLDRVLATKEYLMAVATTGVGDTSLVICGSSPAQVQRASLLVSSKFIGHILPLHDERTRWIALVHDINWGPYEELALWDVIEKSAKDLINPSLPPPGSRSIAEILAAARTRLQRLTPQRAFEELQDPSISIPVILVDIRPHAQRMEHGNIPGSLVIERNVLEWRFDPRCLDGRLDIATRYDLRVIVFCQEGYTSSLAAASLQDIGLLNATDIDGGFKAWKEAGLPVGGE